MTHPTVEPSSLVIGYLTLRKFVGLLGTSLPFVLAVGAFLFFKTDIQASMSSYYHTGMRDVFVGVLFAIGVFMLSYRGYGNKMMSQVTSHALSPSASPCFPPHLRTIS